MSMRPPTAILAEDEKALRDELRQMLSELWPELIVMGEAGTGIEALQLLEKHAPDLMFLDIQMPGMTGLEVAHQAQGRCHIVFVTAYDAYAVAAFETGALDYVLKPLERERLRLAVDRVRQRMGSNPQNLEAVLRELIKNAEPRKYLRWINASVGSLMQLITVEDVVYFQADAKYTRVVTATCEALIRKPLNELRNELDPAVFWQVHRSTIVNANAIAGVSRDMFGHINLKLKRRDEKLNVSESHAQLFRQM
jgi:DNA-binding LytR/AlgR family response regulator